eukprot:8143289-Ditylum_brightwellii.AAC.1
MENEDDALAKAITESSTKTATLKSQKRYLQSDKYEETAITTSIKLSLANVASSSSTDVFLTKN